MFLGQSNPGPSSVCVSMLHNLVHEYSGMWEDFLCSESQCNSTDYLGCSCTACHQASNKQTSNNPFEDAFENAQWGKVKHIILTGLQLRSLSPTNQASKAKHAFKFHLPHQI